MKNIFLFALFFCFVGGAMGQAPNWAWAKSAGGQDYDWANCVATDDTGNIYIAGDFFSDSLIVGTDTLLNSGNQDVFLIKYNSSGSPLWARNIGGGDSDNITSLAVDRNGDVLIAGYFYSNLLTLGTTTLTNSGNSDLFIARYAGMGNLIWAQNGIGTSSEGEIHICTDSLNNLYACGTYSSSTLTLDTITLNNSGGVNVFISKFDSGGNILWAHSSSGTGMAATKSVTTDIFGNIYFTGIFDGAPIGLGSTTLINSGVANSNDVFIAKYSNTGNQVWAISFGGNDNDDVRSICTDQSGNLYTIGTFMSPTINIGSTTLTNSGFRNLYIAKFNSSASSLWVKGAGGTGDDYGSSITTNSTGDLICTGYFSSPVISFGTSFLNLVGGFDMFVAKYDSNGNVMWLKSNGGAGDDEDAMSVAIDPFDNIVIAGLFLSDTLNFGPTVLINADTNSVVSHHYDIFLAKLIAITGVFELQTPTSQLSLSPNPTTNFLTLTTGQLPIESIHIYSVLGEVVYKSAIPSPKPEISVDVSALAKGMYFVQVQTAFGMLSKKVIKE